MNDLISRQAAIDAFIDLPNCYNGFSDTYDKACIIGVLEELPPAQQWIPCDDGVPEVASDWKNVTVVDESGDTAYRYSSIGWYLGDGMWIVNNEPMEESSSIRVVAWAPLPEPYKGES